MQVDGCLRLSVIDLNVQLRKLGTYVWRRQLQIIQLLWVHAIDAIAQWQNAHHSWEQLIVCLCPQQHPQPSQQPAMSTVLSRCTANCCPLVNNFVQCACKKQWKKQYTICTHTRLTALCPGLPGWASTRKVKPIWILLKQETVSGSGISWAICNSAPRSRQITTPAPHHSVFYRLNALPATQPTASKHWRLNIQHAI